MKSTTTRLIQDARTSGATAVLYGHTHIPECHMEEDGMWVLNPGSSGSWGGSVGLIAVENGKIISCRNLGLMDLEEMV